MKMLEEKVPVALGEWTAGEVRMGGGGHACYDDEGDIVTERLPV